MFTKFKLKHWCLWQVILGGTPESAVTQAFAEFVKCSAAIVKLRVADSTCGNPEMESEFPTVMHFEMQRNRVPA